MEKIEDILGISMHPVAIYRETKMPSDASVPSAHCSIPSLFVKCARTGKKCAADKDHIFCHGAVSGFGFGGIPDRQRTAMRLSAIPPECSGEFKHEAKGDFRTPEIAALQIEPIKDYGDGTDAIVFQSLEDALKEDRPIEVVVFLCDPTRISALTLLAGFGKTTPGPAVIVPYGHACQQIYAIPRAEGESDDPHAVIGMTDLYARRYIPADMLSFAVPFRLYQRMENDIEDSYFGKETWPETLKKCIRNDQAE